MAVSHILLAFILAATVLAAKT
jgi:xanthine/uracil permease